MILDSMIMARDSFAFPSLVSVKFVAFRIAPSSRELLKSVPERLAENRLAPVRFESLKSIPLKSAQLRSHYAHSLYFLIFSMDLASNAMVCAEGINAAIVARIIRAFVRLTNCFVKNM